MGASSSARAEQSRMSVSTSSAPSCAQALAVAEPMPPAAPVMSTRLPFNAKGVEPNGIVMASLSLCFLAEFLRKGQGRHPASGLSPRLWALPDGDSLSPVVPWLSACLLKDRFFWKIAFERPSAGRPPIRSAMHRPTRLAGQFISMLSES